MTWCQKKTKQFRLGGTGLTNHGLSFRLNWFFGHRLKTNPRKPRKLYFSKFDSKTRIRYSSCIRYVAYALWWVLTCRLDSTNRVSWYSFTSVCSNQKLRGVHVRHAIFSMTWLLFKNQHCKTIVAFWDICCSLWTLWSQDGRSVYQCVYAIT